MSDATDDPEKVEAFLKDLTELSRRHGIAIGGCGCCHSPSLEDADSATSYYRVDPSGYYGFEWIDPAEICRGCGDRIYQENRERGTCDRCEQKAVRAEGPMFQVDCPDCGAILECTEADVKHQAIAIADGMKVCYGSSVECPECGAVIPRTPPPGSAPG